MRLSMNGGGALGAPSTTGLELALNLGFDLFFDLWGEVEAVTLDRFDDGAVEFFERNVFVGGRVVLGTGLFRQIFLDLALFLDFGWFSGGDLAEPDQHFDGFADFVGAPIPP